MMHRILYLLLLTTLIQGDLRPHVNHRKIPKGLMFGTATSAYQTEGAWDRDGKTESIWDRLLHTDSEPCFASDCSNGDLACDSYNKVDTDVKMMRDLGIDFYRFSIAWSRLLPTSFPDKINEAGVAHYNRLIDEMIKYNIEPVVTLYHWDLPQKLQDLGGWVNPYIVDWFADYARVCFELFGDRVKHWVTINEPWQVCFMGYESDWLAPVLNMTGNGGYLCSKNVLLAHAKAFHIYDEEYRSQQDGSIGLSISASWIEPENEEHRETAENYLEFEWGWFANPIFSEEGDFPKVMKEIVEAKSAEQGFARSRLPEFTKAEIEYVKGSSDFFGLNHYNTFLVYSNESINGIYPVPSYQDDHNSVFYSPESWTISPGETVKIQPTGFYKLLTRIREKYNNPDVFITENGYPYSEKGLVDKNRVKYITEYIHAMLDAIEDGSNVLAYTVWSLMDNFEWYSGYSVKYGIYEVDFNSTDLKRTPRFSAFVYNQILRTRIILDEYNPDITAMMTIHGGHPKRFNFKSLPLNRFTEYDSNIPIFVTENGCASIGALDDDDRVGQYTQYLNALLDEIDDGCNVIGYTEWSLIDNFEWRSGYTERFCYEVDFERLERTRTPRRSAFVYKEILRTRTLDPNYVPDTSVMTIEEGH